MGNRADENVRPRTFAEFEATPGGGPVALQYLGNALFVIQSLAWYIAGTAGDQATIAINGVIFAQLLVPPTGPVSASDSLVLDLTLEENDEFTVVYTGTGGTASGFLSGYEWASPVER